MSRWMIRRAHPLWRYRSPRAAPTATPWRCSHDIGGSSSSWRLAETEPRAEKSKTRWRPRSTQQPSSADTLGWRACPTVPSSVRKAFSSSAAASRFTATARPSSRDPRYTSPYPPFPAMLSALALLRVKGDQGPAKIGLVISGAFTLVEAIGGLVELVVGEAAPGGLVRRRPDVDDALLDEGLVRVAAAAEGQQPLEAPAPEVVHPPTEQRTNNLPNSSQYAAMPTAQLGKGFSRTPSVLQEQLHERGRGQRWRYGVARREASCKQADGMGCDVRERGRGCHCPFSFSLPAVFTCLNIMERGRQAGAKAAHVFLFSIPPLSTGQRPAYSLVLGSPPSSGRQLP
jgi:hypothetical protein